MMAAPAVEQNPSRAPRQRRITGGMEQEDIGFMSDFTFICYPVGRQMECGFNPLGSGGRRRIARYGRRHSKTA